MSRRASHGRVGAVGTAFRGACFALAGLGVATAAGTDSGREPLDSIAAIRRLPVAQLTAGTPARIRGVVTFKEDWIVVQDGDQAIAATYEHADEDAAAMAAGRPPRCGLGSTVEIEGIATLSHFAPHVNGTTLREIAPGELPEPEPADLGLLWDGGLHDRRVAVDGVAQGVYLSNGGRDWAVVVDVAGRRLLVDVSRRMRPARPDDLVDAEIRVAGIVGCDADTSGRFVAPRLRICRGDDITIRAAAPSRPFDLPVTPLAAVNLFQPAPLRGHRLRTAGTVTFVAADRIYLEEDGLGVQVGLASGGRAAGDTVVPGDRVEVAAFRDLARDTGLAEAIVRKVAAGPPPEPLAIQPAEILRLSRLREQQVQPGAAAPKHDGCLIRCRGRIETVHPLRDETVVTLSGDGIAFDARLAGGLPPAEVARLTPGSEVEAVGIVEVHHAPIRSADVIRTWPKVDRIGLWVRGSGDLVVVRQPSWWTPRRLAIAAGGLAAAAAAAGCWGIFLRREVARQTARAVDEATARRQAAIEFEAALRERTRIAADLHDTLLQTMTGIGYQLQSGQAAGLGDDADGRAAAHIRTAERLARHATRQLRGTVWALRALPNVAGPFDEPVRGLLEHLTAGRGATAAVRVSGAPVAVDETVARQVLFVIQEAVINALQHGHARRLDVALEFEADHEGLGVAIEDDGAGFATGAQPGPAAGHFGIQGMRERIERLGGWLEIASAPGRGTTVRLRVPRPLLPPADRKQLAMETEVAR